MYRATGAGEEAHPPALLCMVVLLQGYVGASDAEAVELSLVDLRWQMVLDCLGAATPPFSQGGLQAFRERMIAHEMDRVLLDRTVALVRSGAMTEAEGRSVSKALRAAIDSRPLAGAGRVEDTINLLGHAARSIVQLVSKLTDRDPAEICRKAGIPLLLAPSIKAGLDIDWSDPKQKAHGRRGRRAAGLLAATLGGPSPGRRRIRATAPVHRGPRAGARTRPGGRSRRRDSHPCKASLPTGASRCATARCGTDARAARSASTATRSTSLATWTSRQSSPAP